MISASTTDTFTQVIIIGAGMSGLAMACQLKKQLCCEDFVIYDRAPSFGGTWYFNKYLGCGVDIPAAFYSFSFALYPQFTCFFPKQEEILQYIHGVADEFSVALKLVGHTEWEGADWQDSEQCWEVRLREIPSGRKFTRRCRILISAVGGLTNPKHVMLQGIERFQGNIVHTALWDQETAVAGKNVIVIGNGASATQFIPAIADDAASINQFIRTPHHYMPGKNFRINGLWSAIFQSIPVCFWLFRAFIFLYLETSILLGELTWMGKLMRRWETYRSRQHVRKCAPEEQYWSLLTPEYSIGCKRRVFDNDGYLKCLHRPNVDITNDPVVAVEEQSITTQSGKRFPADLIVFATGFSLSQYDVDRRGRNGRTRQEHWNRFGCIQAFETVAMAEFPNFLYILGPNSGRGHTSTVYSIESHVDLVIRIIKPIMEHNAVSVVIKQASEERFNTKLKSALRKTVFTNMCRSWYIDPRTDQNWFTYPWNSFRMWYTTQYGGKEDWLYTKAVASLDNQSRPCSNRCGREALPILIMILCILLGCIFAMEHGMR
ncbi:monooxygenase [Aspergillus niger ATCC 13496]|uniref:Monooxygenase n=1 Tax=Aspergillus niger ATCC 13496 TaxID=1353008 RepID=A0A370CAQ8_ASPNG|nr:monooxygenase [Aspergillus niger CBS 513.88]RDH24878.1 monooxygenase [Aspergillus niger ATCC 13496]|eukprot:XP_001398607.2 monooxygenase [Aspergillus niger CBS 513.88]